MKEVTNRKSGRSYYLTDEEFRNLQDLGLERNFKDIRDIEPIRKMIPIPKIEPIIVKKSTNKKHI